VAKAAEVAVQEAAIDRAFASIAAPQGAQLPRRGSHCGRICTVM
jgi:hypothetical protein